MTICPLVRSFKPDTVELGEGGSVKQKNSHTKGSNICIFVEIHIFLSSFSV
jgi:hypothetical protein